MSDVSSAGLLQTQALEHAFALPAMLYRDATWAQAERLSVFARSWQLLGPAERVAQPGDHLVGEIAGVPLLVVRGEDGVLRGLHNVCRHRAGPLALCDGRGARSLRCRYHGWNYGLDGRLRTATDMADATGFRPQDIRLPEVPVMQWQGLVFAALDPRMDFAAWTQGIDVRLGARLAGYAFCRRVAYEVACNWKVYVDNYLEGYHLPHVHPALNRLLDYASYRTEPARWHSLQWSPLDTAGAADAGAEGIYGEGEALYYFLWPNTMLNVLPGRLQTNRVIPLDTRRCRVEFDYYYPAAADAAEQARRKRDHTFSDEVQAEDIAICEAVQRGLDSGSYEAGRLNPRRENGVHHFHELLRESLREAPHAAG